MITAVVIAAGLGVVASVGPAHATEPAGTVDTAFSTAMGIGFDDGVSSVAVQSDGKIVVGGAFLSVNGTASARLARLNSDGSPDNDFSTALGTGLNDNVHAVAVQSDGKIVVGGNFTTVNGSSSNRLARLNSDGSVDTAFRTALGTGLDNAVNAVTVQSDGKIVVGGFFTSADGTTNRYVARLNSNGSVDTDFRDALGTGFNDIVYAVAVQSDGKIVVGGNFTEVDGTSSSRVARLDSDGSVDTDFTTALGTGFDGPVTAVAVQSDGEIVVGGMFTTMDGATNSRLARLNSDGSPDTGFTTALGSGFSNNVTAVAVQSNGKIVAGGAFTEVGGISSTVLARLNSDGSVDTDFSTALGTGFNNLAFCLAIQADGKILVGGDFTSVDGTLSRRVVRLFGDPPAPGPGPGPAPDGATGVPNVPQSVAVRGGQFAKRFVVSWSAPRVEDGRPVDSYRVTVKQKGKKKALITTNLSDETLSYVVKRSTLLKKTTRSRGDMSGTSYRYNVWVQAVNDKGTSTAAKERIMLTVKN